jgi:release factor glutamine methyltransferase
VLESLARRLGGEPIAYITGEWEFYSLPIRVTRDTLIPRTDTELLAERAIAYINRRGGETVRVLDLCCGTGCAGIAIAVNCGGVRLTLADKFEEVVRVALHNVGRHNLARRTLVMIADALKPPPAAAAYDVIVCNPPYIPAKRIKTLDRSVKDFEPRSALDGGADGLEFYRAIAGNWKRSLAPDGRMLFEVGEGQADAVCGILHEAGFDAVAVTRDTGGVERVVEAEPSAMLK